jgi:sugar lactone lactonase YvrE
MLNGIAVDEQGYLWVCDGTGSELLRLEAPGHVIVGRYGRSAGVDGPDDVVTDKDFVYYTAAFTLFGAVAKLDRKTGRATTIAAVGPGVNPIAWTPTGKLYAGKTPAASTVLGELLGFNGLYEVDPSTNTFREVMADDAAMNGFTVAPDGMVYGPIGRFTAVVKVDPFTKKITTIRDNLQCVSAVRYSPRDQHLYFLDCGGPPPTKPIISRMALDGSDFSVFAHLSEPPADTLTSTDNFAIAPDGTIYVTRFQQIVVTRVSPDGKVTEDFPVGTK